MNRTSVFAVMLGVVLVCVLSAGACLGAGFFLDPVEDLTPLEMGISPPPHTHYDTVNDGADVDSRYPDGDGSWHGGISAVMTDGEWWTDTFRMAYVGGEQRSGNNITTLKLWLHGGRGQSGGPIEVRLRVNGTYLADWTDSEIRPKQGAKWRSTTYTGNWTQAEIDVMEVQVRARTYLPVGVGVIYVDAIE